MSKPILMARAPFSWPITTKAKPWPPMETYKRDRDAARWFNSSFTTSHSLFHAMAFFLTTGWPPEALDDFVGAIIPKAGWKEDWADAGGFSLVPDETRRKRVHYGPEFSALMHGYWEPKK